MSPILRTWVYNFCSLGPILLLVVGALAYSHYSEVEKRNAEVRELRLYDEANLAAVQGRVQAAYRIHSYLCQNGSHVHKRVPRDEQPCIKTTAFGQEIRASYKVTVEAIEKYRVLHGTHPVELLEVAAELPPEASRAFTGFKLRLDSTGVPRVVTGIEPTHRFNLGRN